MYIIALMVKELHILQCIAHCYPGFSGWVKSCYCDYWWFLSSLLCLAPVQEDLPARVLPDSRHHPQHAAEHHRGSCGLPQSHRETHPPRAALHGHREHYYGDSEGRRQQTGRRKYPVRNSPLWVRMDTIIKVLNITGWMHFCLIRRDGLLGRKCQW